MIYRRGVLPVLVLLSVAVLGVVARIAGGSAAPVPPAASPTSTPTPAQAAPREVSRALDALHGAFNSG